jgi:hypothetical protein
MYLRITYEMSLPRPLHPRHQKERFSQHQGMANVPSDGGLRVYERAPQDLASCWSGRQGPTVPQGPLPAPPAGFSNRPNSLSTGMFSISQTTLAA